MAFFSKSVEISQKYVFFKQQKIGSGIKEIFRILFQKSSSFQCGIFETK